MLWAALHAGTPDTVRAPLQQLETGLYSQPSCDSLNVGNLVCGFVVGSHVG